MPGSSNFEDLVARNTRANQPAAGIPGRLYYVTDENVLERDSGSAWQNVEGAGGTGVDEAGWVAAGETWVYASADDPTYTFTIAGADKTTKYYPGMRVRLSQSTGGTKYFIITKVAFSTDTTVTIYGGTDYDLNNEAISSPNYSVVKAPTGFSLDPTKWTVLTTDTTQRSQSNPTGGVWYNLGTVNIIIPIGAWNVSFSCEGQMQTASAGSKDVYVALSTANNSASDPNLHARIVAGNSITDIAAHGHREYPLILASKTTYYLNFSTGNTLTGTLFSRNDVTRCIIRAISAYL